MNKTVKIILILSLALNVLLIGMIGGHGLKKYHVDEQHHRRHEMVSKVNDLIIALPATQRDEFLQRHKVLQEENTLKIKKIHEIRQKAMDILAQDKPDKHAYNVLIQKISNLKSEFNMRYGAFFGDLMSVSQAQPKQEFFNFIKHHPNEEQKKPTLIP